jgi:flagellar biosynthesis/type III secretory pathway protein FliH
MLIKKTQVNAPPAKQAQSKPSGDKGKANASGEAGFWQDANHLHDDDPSDDALPEWTKETLAMGLVNERRQEDRRGEFRRADDQALISRAEQKAENILQKAQQDGFQQGLDQAESHLLQLQEQLKEVLSGKDEALKGISNDIAVLAVEIAERILKTEISCDETLVNQLVRDVIHKAGKQHKRIVVKVHPQDVKTVRADFETHPIPYYQGEFGVEDDEQISPGSCVVETSSGMIDASFETQLSVLRKLFGMS